MRRAAAIRDGDALSFSWFFYPEAGTGIPGQPVVAAGPPPVGGGGNEQEGGIPSAPGGLREPPPRVVVRTATGREDAKCCPTVAGTAHVILAVEDNGSPALTSYRRHHLAHQAIASGRFFVRKSVSDLANERAVSQFVVGTLQLVAGVHHDRPVPCDRFLDGLARDQEKPYALRRRPARRLRRRGRTGRAIDCRSRWRSPHPDRR